MSDVVRLGGRRCEGYDEVETQPWGFLGSPVYTEKVRCNYAAEKDQVLCGKHLFLQAQGRIVDGKKEQA